MQETYQFVLNGNKQQVTLEEQRPLLEVLREHFGLTGTKFGCGEGECGACTVLLDDEPIRSCITTMAEIADQSITTIEGVANGEQLHPVQQAFIEKSALQCGYCIPGQILSAVALLKATPRPSRTEIVEAMSGNICRCCNYENILSAVEEAAKHDA